MKPESWRAWTGRLDFVDDFPKLCDGGQSRTDANFETKALWIFGRIQAFIHYLFLLLYSVFDAKALSTLNFYSSSGGAQNGIGTF